MKIILGILMGAAIGFALWYFGRCSTGACPMTSNPYISTILGAIFGAMMAAGH